MSFEKYRLETAHGEGISHCCYTDDGQQVITTGEDGLICIWDSVNNNLLKSYKIAGIIQYHTVYKERIFTSIGNEVHTFSFPDLKHDGLELQFSGKVTCIQVNAKYIAACSDDMTIQVKPKHTTEEIFELNGHTEPVISIAFCTNDLLASSDEHTGIKIWDLVQKNCVQHIQSHLFGAHGVPSFEPINGQFVASCDVGRVYIYDTRPLEVHSDNVFIRNTRSITKTVLLDDKVKYDFYSVCAYSKCGRYIAAGTRDTGRILVWDLVAEKKLSQIDDGSDSNKNARIISLSWNPKNNGEFVYIDNAGQLGFIKIVANAENRLEPEEKDRQLVLYVPERTVFIPFLYNEPEEINEFFQEFGEVESVRLHRRYERDLGDDEYYALVQFETVEGASAARSSHMSGVVPGFMAHWYHSPIDLMKFVAAKFWHQLDHPLLVQPLQDECSSLPDLPLETIFSFLNVTDLINAVDVCQRFEEKAKIAFKLKYAEHFSQFDYLANDKSLETLYHKFGETIKSIKCYFGYVSHCTNHAHFLELLPCATSLEKLELGFFNFDDNILMILHRLFNGLKELKLSECTFSDKMKDLFGVCNKLEVLKLDHCNIGTGECIKRNFPKLRVAEFRYNQDILVQAFKQFIIANPQLIALKIKQDFDDDEEEELPPSIFQLITERLTNLIELDVSIDNITDTDYGSSAFDIDVQRFNQFKSLKVLKIDGIAGSMQTFMEVLSTNEIPIERLNLACSGIDLDDATIAAISRMKQMKELKFGGYLSSVHLLRLTRSLPDLNTLQCYNGMIINTEELNKVISHGKNLVELRLKIEDGIEIDSKCYETLANIVRYRPGGSLATKLNISIYSPKMFEQKLNVPEVIIEQCKDWLDITVYRHLTGEHLYN